jgi:uncharacterized protein (DUF2062 family)
MAVIMIAINQGTTPRKLALSFATGAVMGIFPVWGTTTILCFGLSILFRLNIAVMQLVNYLMIPLQLLLVIPFIKAGSYVFSLPPFPYTAGQLVDLFKDNFWLALKESGFAVVTGVGVWMIIAIPFFFLIFYATFFLFSRFRSGVTAN